MNTITPTPSSAPTQEPSWWNLPNALTVARTALVPVFIWAMLQEGAAWRWGSLGIFLVAAFTDQLDGYLARKRGLITDFGKIADPIADKALVLSALVMLSIDGLLPWWVTIVIAIREVGITVMRFFMIRQAVIAASRGGKIKTVTQMFFITGLLIPWPELVSESAFQGIYWFLMVVIIFAVIITVTSGLEYVWNVYKGLQERKSGK